MRTRILLCSGLLILTILAPLSWANAGLPAAGQHLDSQSPETLSASQTQLPELPQVGVGTVHTCGRRPDGTLLCWGLPYDGRTIAPPGVFAQVSVGYNYACALRYDGSIICWGMDGWYQVTVPPAGTFSQISSGGYHACALRTDGSGVC